MAAQPRMTLLVPGGTGQVGTELAARSNHTCEVIAPSKAELDVSSADAVVSAVADLAEQAKITQSAPIVINAAAYTAVDAAEDDEQAAFAINADGPRLLAAACAAHGIPLIHISTDYVFSGDSSVPYQPDDPISPRNVYGRTKAIGEDAVLRSGAQAWVVRTAWVYAATGRNFVKTMVRLAAERETLSVVDDQRGAPVWAADLAGGLIELAAMIVRGHGPERRILHCTGEGEATWFSFAQAIFAEIGADPARVKPCTSAEFPQKAHRPAYSLLSNAAWRECGLTPLRPWRAALAEYFATTR